LTLNKQSGIILLMNKKPITKRQKELLFIIYHYIKNTGYPPTFEEMKEKLLVSSNQSIIDLLTKLEKLNVIKRNQSIARSIVILPVGYKILDKPPLAAFFGAISAGAPIETIEITGEWQTVSPEIAQLKGEVFLLKISGDSMINAGIDNNDIILVKKEKEFVSGNIVLARIGDEATVKRFISDNKPPFIYLKPENPNHKIIPFTNEMRLEGKVISVLKDGYWKKIK